MKQKIISFFFIAFTATFVLLGARFLLFQKTAPAQTQPELSQLLAPNPTSIPLSPAPSTIRFAFDSPLSIPSVLPAFQAEPFDKNAALSLASSLVDALGIIATPSSLITEGQYLRSWETPELAKNVLVTYSASRSTITYRNSRVLPEDASVSIDSFLAPFEKRLSLKSELAKNVPAPLDGLLIQDSPFPSPFTTYSVAFTINGIPVAGNPADRWSGYIVVDANSVIRSASFVLPPVIKRESGSVSLLSQKQVLDSLSAGRGRIISYGDSEYEDPSKKTFFSSIRVRKGTILYSLSGSMLLPALVLDGEGVSQKGSVPVSLFLWGYAASQ